MSEVSVQFYETWLYVVSDHKKTETVKNWLASLSSSDASFSDVNKATTRKSKGQNQECQKISIPGCPLVMLSFQM